MHPIAKPLRDALQNCRRHFIYAAVFSAFMNLLYIAPTIYMLQIYDRVIPSRGDITLLGLTAALILALATLSVLDAMRSRLFVHAGVRLNRQLVGVILGAAFSSRNRRDAAARQAVREFDTLRQILTGPSALAVFDLPWMPIYILVCFLLHPALGLIVTVGGAALALIAWRAERATKAPLEQANAAANLAYVSHEQAIARAEVIRAMGMRQAMVNRQLVEREAAAAAMTRATFTNTGYVTLSRFIRLLLQSAALGVGAWLAIHDQISGGAIFAASFLAARALGPLEQMLGSWKSLSQANTAWRTLESLLSDGAESAAPVTHLPQPEGALEVERLIIRSPAGDRLLLQGVSFQIQPGEVVAVVGPSGAGKSTLIRALAGASDYAGAIRFDGSEMKDHDPERLGRWLGYAPQDAVLFAGTVKDNISRFSAANAAAVSDLEEIDARAIEAAKACGAHDMIVRLPGGYDTLLGWSGRGLSAGQSHRIALARALYGSPRVLMLDEPDAHLDGEGEAILVETLRRMKAQKRTVIIVSHRSAVLSVVDRILVMRDGRVEMIGPRDAVMAQLSPQPPRPHPVALSA